MEFFDWLLDTGNFLPRARCGDWPTWLIITSQVSDCIVFLAYSVIAVVLWYGWRIGRKKHGVPSLWVMLAFASFIFFCGVGHLWNALVFWYPAYRLYIFWDVLRAISTVAMAGAMIPVMNTILSYPTHEEFKAQAEAAIKAKAEVVTLAAETERLRALAQKKLDELQAVAGRLESQVSMHVEANELRDQLAEIRRGAVE